MIKGTGRVTRSAPALSVLVLSLLLAFAPAATADPTPAQAAVALNTWRASLGELPVATATVPNWNQGCQLHNAYEQQNGVLTHYENSAAPGYTPLGATAGPDSVLAEFYGTGPPLSAASLLPAAVWDGAVFHRAALLQPRLGQIGFNSTTFSSGGAYTSWVCLWDQNIGSGEPASPAAIDNSRTTPQLTLYPSPGNGEVNVPTTFPGHEGPDPEAETGVNGAPLGWLLNVEINGPWADAGGGGIVFAHGVSATLAPDGTGNAVPVVVSQCGPNGCGSSGGTAEGPYFSGGFGIFPLHPLASKTTYHVSVSGTVTDTGASRAAKDYPFTKSWCFSTGSTYAVNGDCAAAAPGTGGGAGGGGAGGGGGGGGGPVAHPGAPRVSNATLFLGRRPKLALTLLAGTNAPALKALQVTLPHGVIVAGTARALGRGLKLAGHRFVLRRRGNSLTLTLRAPSRRLQLVLSSPALSLSRIMAGKVRHHAVHALTVVVRAISAAGATTTIRLTFRYR